MTLDQFTAALSDAEPPAGPRPALIALRHDGRGDWDAKGFWTRSASSRSFALTMRRHVSPRWIRPISVMAEDVEKATNALTRRRGSRCRSRLLQWRFASGPEW